MPFDGLPKLGKRPATPPRVRSLRRLFGALPRPAIPQRTNRTPLVQSWGMDGNDQWGDCVEAGACHAVDLWTASAGEPRTATTDDALAMYSCFGFDASAGPSGANPTDSGTNIQDMLQRWATVGYSIGGQSDKIDGFASLTPSDIGEIKESVAWLGCAIVGLALPLAYQTMVDPSQPFDIPEGQSLSGDWAYGSAGGHCVLIADYDPVNMTVITWGAPKIMTPRFWLAYADEAYAVLDRDFATVAIPGEAWAQLQSDMATLQACGAA